MIPPIPKIAWDKLPSNESNQGSPIPTGKLFITVSVTPPIESCSSRALFISSKQTSSMLFKTGNDLFFKYFISSLIFSKLRSLIDPHCKMWVAIFIPTFSSACKTIAPAATSAAVILPEKCPPPL